MAKVLCERISSRRSLLALGWSITSILALGALITAAIMSARINSYYNNLAALYSDDGNYYYNNGQNQEESGSEDQNEEGNINQNLSSISSHSIAFAGLYTACCSVAMSIFGSMSVVGFVSLTGNFIEPAWTRKESENKVGEKELGIFIGALFLFSNLCLVCAVVLGEFQVSFILVQHSLLFSVHFLTLISVSWTVAKMCTTVDCWIFRRKTEGRAWLVCH